MVFQACGPVQLWSFYLMDEEPGGTASHKCNSANRPESQDSCPAAETMSTHICPAAETVSDSARLVGRRFKIRVKS